jgi:hypothetical protein
MFPRVLLISIICITILSCSGRADNPVSTTHQSPGNQNIEHQASATNLWGFWKISIDTENSTVESVPVRSTQFTANVTTFLYGSPPKLGFSINNISFGADYTDVDIDVSMTHPFAGLYQYNGYDVRGVFMGNGSASLDYNSDLTYPVPGTDQLVIQDPDTNTGGPDGYTRWFNISEFSEGGPPLFSYTPGDLASPGFAGTASLCPFKYYADGLSADEDLFTFLIDTANNGVFTAGGTNTRNYLLRFPNGTGINYGYAVIANWEALDIHPSNAPEIQTIKVTDSSNLYFIDNSDNGGNLILDIDAFGWQTSDGNPHDFDIIIESSVVSTVQTFDPELIALPGGDNYSTYHVEIPADIFSGPDDQFCWLIFETKDFDYTNEFGTPNLANTDPLAAYFKVDLTISDIKPNTPPIVTGIEDEIDKGDYNAVVSIDDAITYYVIYTDPDAGQSHTTTWYVTGDGEGPPAGSDEVTMPIDWGSYGEGSYDIYVEVEDSIDSTLAGPFDITVVSGQGGVITFGGTGTEYILGMAVDSTGAIYTGGYFWDDTNLDPDGNDPHTSVGGGDMWLNKIDAAGNFVYGYTWGSSPNHEYVWEIAVDDSDNIYVCGHFTGTIDFDPDPFDTDIHVASSNNGNLDPFLMKFDSSGDYVWGLSWGGSSLVTAFDVRIYNSQYLYITGYFLGTADIDPSSGTDTRTGTSSSGNPSDAYVVQLDLDGNYQWGQSWGANATAYGFDCDADGSGEVTVIGTLQGLGDLDPTTGVQNYSSVGFGDAWIVHFDGAGTWEWSHGYGGDSWDQANDIVADSTGYIYLTGGTASTSVDFDPGPGDATKVGQGSYDGFMCKYSSAGVFQWVNMFAESGHDNTWGITLDEYDNILMCGHFNGTMDADPGAGTHNIISNGESDSYIVKLDNDGNFAWAESWGGTSFDNGETIENVPGGLIHIGGRFSETVDFEPGSGVTEKTSNGNYDTWINMLLPTGTW